MSDGSFYDAGLAALQADTAAQVRNSVSQALPVNPDSEAELRRNAAVARVPMPAAREFPDHVKVQAQMSQFDADMLARKFPTTAQLLTNGDVAKITHDDIPRTTEVEQATRALVAPPTAPAPNEPSLWQQVKTPDFWVGMAKYLFSANTDGKDNLTSDVGSAARGVSGKIGTTAGLAAGGALQLVGAGGTAAQDAAFAVAKGYSDQTDAEGAAGQADAFHNKLVKSAATLGLQLPMMLAGGAGGPVAPLAKSGVETLAQYLGGAAVHGAKAMSVPALTDATDTMRRVYEKTGDIGAAARAGQAQFAVSTAGGIVPLNAPGGLFARLVGGAAVGGVQGEVGRQAMNVALPDSMQTQFNPEDVALSAVTGSLTAGVMGPQAPGNRAAAVRAFNDAFDAARAEQQNEQLVALGKAAAASKLRERDPETFKQFVRNVVDQGDAPKGIYIDAHELNRVLAAHEITFDELNQTMPEVAAQLKEATGEFGPTNGLVRIPVEDFATHIAGSDLEQPLMEHMRVTPEGKTLAESKAYKKAQAEELQQQAAKLTERNAGDQAYAESLQRTQQDIVSRLEAIGMKPEIAAANAAPLAAFYQVHADRLGILPHEMAERYPVAFTNRAIDGTITHGQDGLHPDAGQQAPRRDLRGAEAAPDFATATRIKSRGAPATLFRGADRPLAPEHFDVGSLGKGSGRPSSGLGVWFTPDRGEAGRYGNVEQFQLDLRNPKHIKVEDLPAFDNVGQAYAYARNLEKQGFDGIVLDAKHLGGERHAIAFRPEQVIRHEDTFQQSLSTRVPTTKKNPENHLDEKPLLANIDAMASEPAKLEQNVNLFDGYPGLKLKGTTEQKLEQIVEHVKDNLLFLHDSIDPDTRERSKLWYDGARRIVDQWAPKYDISDAQMSGMLAVLSPQKDWFMNVSLAQRVADAMHDQQKTRWDDKMSETASRIFGKEQYAKDLAEITGKTLGELEDPIQKAMWIRAYDETHNDRGHQIVSPEGAFTGPRTNANGTPTKTGWGSLREIAKAVSVYEDGSPQNISDQLGGEHKVRNFYNNIYAPNSEHGFATIDTHAVAAGLLRPLSGSSPEVLHNFGANEKGQPGPAKSAKTGLNGTYAIFHEAYRRAAAERGLLPREMQSITWEAVRGLFQDTFKSQKGNVDAINEIWSDYAAGKLTLEQARAAVVERAGGIADPEWLGSAAGAHEAAGPAADEAGVSRVQLPRRGAEPAAGGSDASRGAEGLDRFAEESPSFRQSSPDAVPTGQLIGLPSKVKVDGREVTFGPFAPAHEAARAYMDKAGLPYDPPQVYTKVDTERARRIAAEFEAMKHDPHNPEVKAAYDAMIKETLAQYEAMLATGLKVEFNDGKDPYGNPRNAILDVVHNNHLFVFSTREGFGTDATFDPKDNPLLAETAFTDANGKPMLANDVFRAVHDYFGHVKDGVGFRADGEENAWRSHAAMYSPLARRAMTTETRGQNSWLNFGPYGEKNRTATTEDTHFADQKIGLLPEWVSIEGMRDPARPLEQESRGTFSPSTKTITQLKGADLSTFQHELGHYFLDTLAHMAAQPDAPASVKADMATLLRWGDIPDLATWDRMSMDEQRALHEKFATGWETYLMRGEAPTMELRSLFARFRAWMLHVYKSLKGAPGEYTPEVRGVFDRMIASEDAIAQAEHARRFMALFDEPGQAGMDPQQWHEYQSLGDDATERAVEELTGKTLRDMARIDKLRAAALKSVTADAKEKRTAIENEVKAEVLSTPVYRAWSFLTGKKDKTEGAEAKNADATLGAGKLNYAALESAFGKAVADRLYELKMTAKKSGFAPDALADLMGFPDGQTMVKALVDAEPPASVVEGMTDQRMLERHGEIADPQSMQRTADELVANEARSLFVATELKALKKATSPAREIQRAAKEAAGNAIDTRRIRDISEATYTAAATRSAKAAEQAMAKGDTAGAAAAKRDQILNMELARAAREGNEYVAKAVEYLKKFDTPSTREAIDLEYRDQIDALLDRADLRKSVSNRDLDRREALVQFVERMAAQGYKPGIAEALLDEAQRWHYKDMPLAAFKGLVDSIKSIEHLGKLKTKLRDGQETREIAALADEVKASAAKLPQRAPESNRGLSRLGKAWLATKSFGRSAEAAMLKMEQVFDWLDARNPNGVLNRVVFRRLADAGTLENDMLARVKSEIDKLVDANLDSIAKEKRIYVADGLIDGATGLPQRFTTKEMLMLAGNYGNESNLAKMAKGERWDPVAIKDFLDQNMTKAHWDFVAGMGRVLESLWPEKLAMDRRLGNTSPEKIEPRPFSTPHGDYAGWYWPMMYDPARSQDVAERGARAGDAMFENIYTRANTDTGRMNTRNENYARPLLLDLDALPRMIKEEIHDIAYREAIIDSDRFLSHPTVRKAIIGALSQEHYDQIRPWLQSIAADGKLTTDGARGMEFMNAIAREARMRATMVGLGLRLSTAVVHGSTAALESVSELGAKWMASGLKDFADPTQWAANKDFIFERSGEMRNRMNEVDRDVREHLREIDLRLSDPTTSAVQRGADVMRAHAYSLIAGLDMASALPTWMGAYKKAMTPPERGGLGMSEQDAVYFADKTVRNAHGGTGIKDMARVQRGTEFQKLFTMFYTFWNHNINRIVDTAKLVASPEHRAMLKERNNWTNTQLATTVILRTLAYTIGTQAIHALISAPPKKEDNSEGWLKWAAKEFLASAFAGIPIARDISAHFLTGRDYSVTPAASLVDAMGRQGTDAAHALTGQQVSDKWLKHAITSAGYVFNLPLGQPASTAQFLWDYSAGNTHPQTAQEWWAGLAHGDVHAHH